MRDSKQLFKLFLDLHYPEQWSPNDRSIEIMPTGGRAATDLVPRPPRPFRHVPTGAAGVGDPD